MLGLVVGCSSGADSLVSTSEEPPGENCENGGERLDYGRDDDGDGTLGNGEIDGTIYACDGAPGSPGNPALVEVSDEPAGTNCAAGGQRVDYGIDDNGDGTLGSDEISGTVFVRDGADGARSLLTITEEPEGVNCNLGGIRVDSGIDDNGNGSLDAGEITDTTYVCDGVPSTFSGFLASYVEIDTFQNNAGLLIRPNGFTFDGTDHWMGGGGTGTGNTYAEYDGARSFVSFFQPGLDFRSVFTKGSGVPPVFARVFGSNDILRQTAPGTFTVDLTLGGDPIFSQAGVVWDDEADLFIAHENGSVARWDAAGNRLGDLPLVGYGTLPGEPNNPSNARIAVGGGLYLTFAEGALSAWDRLSGERLDTTTLTNAGTELTAEFSFSVVEGLVWIVDDDESTWRGYDVLP
ncbi:MAG: hypothetical protein AAF602_03365 [Myxococcota bacterium]